MTSLVCRREPREPVGGTSGQQGLGAESRTHAAGASRPSHQQHDAHVRAAPEGEVAPEAGADARHQVNNSPLATVCTHSSCSLLLALAHLDITDRISCLLIHTYASSMYFYFIFFRMAVTRHVSRHASRFAPCRSLLCFQLFFISFVVYE